jgi:thiaminase/transcriptional activator TenA
MTTAAPPLLPALLAGAADDWTAYVGHRFVRGLADGRLADAAFRRYLVQDYLFLGHFARAHGLAAFKAETLADIRAAAAGLAAIVDREMDLHVAYAAGWGLTADDLAAAAEAPPTIAYTRYVLERGLAGDLLDLVVALAPCVLGYAEIGQALAADPATVGAGNPYRSWIETYAGPDYQALAAAHAAQVERLWRARGTPARLPALTETFRTATRLETAFWEDAFSHAAAAG